MFSDELTFCTFQSFSKLVRRPPNARYNPRYIIATVKKPLSVIVWGSVTAQGRAGLLFLPKKETMNAEKYLNLLQEKLPVWMNIRKTQLFQQDGVPCPTAKKLKKWFQDKPFNLLDPWPGASPDLNIIENVWSHMKKKVALRSPSTYEELVNSIKEVWTLSLIHI